MYARLRLLKIANVLLYGGPLLAGMTGLGWSIVGPFVAIFVLWLMLVRPEQWPATLREWFTGRALGASITQIVSQLLLVTVLMALGRGAVGLAGITPTLHPVVPLGLSVFALFVSRLVWNAREAANAGVFLDEDAEEAGTSQAESQAATDIEPLLALPDTISETDLRDRLIQFMSGPAARDRLAALSAALGKSGRSHDELRRAVVIWCTEPEIVAPGRVPNALSTAFALSNGDADLLRLFLPRALALVAAFPDRAAGVASPADLRLAAKEALEAGPHSDLPAYLRADLSDGLMALARSVEGAAAKLQPVVASDVRPSPLRGSPSAV